MRRCGLGRTPHGSEKLNLELIGTHVGGSAPGMGARHGLEGRIDFFQGREERGKLVFDGDGSRPELRHVDVLGHDGRGAQADAEHRPVGLVGDRSYQDAAEAEGPAVSQPLEHPADGGSGGWRGAASSECADHVAARSFGGDKVFVVADTREKLGRFGTDIGLGVRPADGAPFVVPIDLPLHRLGGEKSFLPAMGEDRFVQELVEQIGIGRLKG